MKREENCLPTSSDKQLPSLCGCSGVSALAAVAADPRVGPETGPDRVVSLRSARRCCLLPAKGLCRCSSCSQGEGGDREGCPQIFSRQGKGQRPGKHFRMVGTCRSRLPYLVITGKSRLYPLSHHPLFPRQEKSSEKTTAARALLACFVTNLSTSPKSLQDR